MADDQTQNQQTGAAPVSREEYEAQTARIDDLEEQIIKLKAQKSAKPGASAPSSKLETAVRAAFKHMGINFDKFMNG